MGLGKMLKKTIGTGLVGVVVGLAAYGAHELGHNYHDRVKTSRIYTMQKTVVSEHQWADDTKMYFERKEYKEIDGMLFLQQQMQQRQQHNLPDNFYRGAVPQTFNGDRAGIENRKGEQNAVYKTR